METLFFVVVIVLFGLGVYAMNQEDKRKWARQITRHEALKESEIKLAQYYEKEKSERDAHERYIQALSAEYGEPDYDDCVVLRADPGKLFDPSRKILFYVSVFGSASKILIDGTIMDFKEILGYTLIDEATSQTVSTSTGELKTDTGSLMGRAAIGGALMGGLGALAGAATAKKNLIMNSDASQTDILHNYSLFINVNNINKPIITICIGDNIERAQSLQGVLNIIIARNKTR